MDFSIITKDKDSFSSNGKLVFHMIYKPLLHDRQKKKQRCELKLHFQSWVYYPSIQKGQARISLVQGHPDLPSSYRPAYLEEEEQEELRFMKNEGWGQKWKRW